MDGFTFLKCVLQG